LKTVGAGGTKREARHVASAKLLALLFPDCKSMVLGKIMLLPKKRSNSRLLLSFYGVVVKID
jgi:hypothetical protein